ncbi:putative RNA methyltransferase [Arthrobacter sp. B0490]|uniref:putative RNA methyltransferase n=1 Tax=Arthrobacter sp. B0490 TaxID=2058891 RepID=UPI000CE43460|nr:methyltransferase domain-containing protein [Arthrobacter sp. B0490]
MSAVPRPLLLCPVCASPLEEVGQSLACARGHRFDAARQGYFNLLTGRGSPFEGDSVEMVDARDRFLGSGAYAPLRSAVVDAVLQHSGSPGVVLDAGAGTGYYLEGLVGRSPGCFPVALDISKIALRRAARRLPGGISIVWDVWRPLPLADGSVDVLLNVFAPRNAEEFVRVLAPGGCLVVVTPRPGHLSGLEAVGPLLSVPAHKADDVLASFGGALVETAREDLDYVLSLPRGLARSALVMGPAARHAPAEGRSGGKADGAGAPLEVAARFTVQVLARGGRSSGRADGTDG